MKTGPTSINKNKIRTAFFSIKEIVLSILSLMSTIFENWHKMPDTPQIKAFPRNENVDIGDNRGAHISFLRTRSRWSLFQIRDKNRDRTSANKTNLPRNFIDTIRKAKKGVICSFGLSFEVEYENL
ncbi:MAG: hypothetical protein JSS09_04105 [Verrucomicrobia bacterium]|nr:hypothetical protein [Verrucomicrobiota bacterium]